MGLWIAMVSQGFSKLGDNLQNNHGDNHALLSIKIALNGVCNGLLANFNCTAMVSPSLMNLVKPRISANKS